MLNKTSPHVTVSIPKLRKEDGHVHLPQNTPSPREDTRLGGSRIAGLRPAVFLDRDGVLVEDVGFLRRPADLRILPGVAQALRSLVSRFRMVVITNQSGIARGLFSENDLLAVHQELSARLAQEGAALDAFYYCPHLQGGAVSVYSVDCECRKPKPGMLLQASSDLGLSLGSSYMVGDNPRDVLAGLAAGSKGVIIGESGTGCPDSVMVARSLLEAAELILADSSESIDLRSKPFSDGTGSSAGAIPAMPGWEKSPCRP